MAAIDRQIVLGTTRVGVSRLWSQVVAAGGVAI
jgi:hypothetical protein